MHSTTIDYDVGVDLVFPSVEDTDSELNVNTGVISVRYADIPTYLHRSEFYLSMDSNQRDEFISIPAKYLWLGSTINNAKEFRQYLQTLHFWGVRHFTLEGLEFVFPSPRSMNAFEAFEFRTKVWNTITDVCGADSTLHHAMRDAMDQITDSYNYGEHRDLWGEEKPYWLSVSCDEKAASVKASFKRLLCRYFVKEDCLQELIAMHEQHGDIIWNQWTSLRAAQNGSIECLQYLIDNGCACDSEAAVKAAMAGHLHILQYLHDNKLGFDGDTNKWPPRVAESAVRGGHHECLAFIHENGHPWDARSFFTAGETGQMRAFQYLCDNGCKWNDNSLLTAIARKQLDVVKYMVEQGCPLPASACVVAGRGDDLPMLKYLHECGCAWYEDESDEVINWTAGQAALHGNIDTLRYALEHGCPLGDNILIDVFLYRRGPVGDTGLLRCITYLIEFQSQEMDGRLFSLAFCSGFFQCVRYLLDTGCPYTIVKEYPHRLEMSYSDPDQFYECLNHAIERGWLLDESLLGAINSINSKQGEFARTVEYLQQEGLWSDVVAHDDDDYDFD